MSVITFSILGLVILYKVCSPLNKYRTIILISAVGVNVVFLITTLIVTLLTNRIEPILQIPYLDMNGPAYLVTGIIIAIFAAIYLFVYSIIDIKKGENLEDEN